MKHFPHLRFIYCLAIFALALFRTQSPQTLRAQSAYPVISADNLNQLVPVKMLSRGHPYIEWSTSGQTLIARTATGNWLYDVDNLTAGPRQLHVPDQIPPDYWKTPDGQIARQYFSSQWLERILGGDHLLQIPASLATQQVPVLFSPRATFLAYSIETQTHLVNLKTGQDTRLDGIPAGFSDDERLIVTLPTSHTAVVSLTQTGQKLRTLLSGLDILDIMFSPDGQFLATAEDNLQAMPGNRRTRLWKTLSGDPLATYLQSDPVGFSADSSLFAYSALDGEIYIDLKTLKETDLHVPNGSQIHGHPNGWSSFAYNTKDSQVIVDYRTGQTKVLKNPALLSRNHLNEQVKLSPNDKYLASTGDDSSLHISLAESGQEVAAYNDFLPPDPYLLRFNQDGSQLVAAAGFRGGETLKLWQLDGDAVPNTLIGSGHRFTHLTFSADRHTLRGEDFAKEAFDQSEVLWFDTASGLLTRQGEHRVFAISPDDHFSVIAPQPYPAPAVLWDETTHKSIKTLQGCIPFPQFFAFSAGSHVLACVSSLNSNNILLWDLASFQPRTTLSGCQLNSSVYVNLGFSADDTLLLCSVSDFPRKLTLWNLSDGKLLQHIDGKYALLDYSTAGLNNGGAALSPDNQYLVLHGYDHDESQTSLLNLQTGQEQFLFSHFYPETFSLDGHLLVSISDRDEHAQATVKFWEIPSGKLLRTINTGPEPIVSFNTDGTMMALADRGSAVQLWAVSSMLP